MRTCSPWVFERTQHFFDAALHSSLERIVMAYGPGFGDWQWKLATLPFAFEGLASGPAFEDDLCDFNVKIKIDLLSNPSEIAAPELMKKLADIFHVRAQLALGTLRGIFMNIMLCHVLISAGKEVDIGLSDGHDKPLRLADILLYSWDGGLDVCVDLTGSSPLTSKRRGRPAVKSDMYSYSSTMTAKDVKALAFKHNIPLDLHPVALTDEWTMDKLRVGTTWVVLWISSNVLRITEGNVVTMSEYLRFPFLDGATIEQGDVLSARDAITSHTTGPLLVNQSLPEKTARLKEVEIPDPKIVAIRERKARAAAKKRAERKRAAGGEGGSKGKPKRRKTSAVRAEEEDSTEEASSASPLRTVAPNPSFLLKDVDDAGTAESRGDEHVSVPYHDSANTTHNHTVDHDESFGESNRGTCETGWNYPAE
ncbi:hypothetical protein Tco_1319879 [Tanacetum coccineum]